MGQHVVTAGRTFTKEEPESFLEGLDNVELTTIGIDVGTSTFHLLFARLYLHRATQNLSSRFVVRRREVLWRSPVVLTPYHGNKIDAEFIGSFVATSHRSANIVPEMIDSGVVILTGEALRRQNARAIADGIAAGSGKFVCVSAGHHLESMLAAYGSGATQYSRSAELALLHIDIGGGTTKLSLLEHGEVRATAAVKVGGRQVAWDASRRIITLAAGARTIARSKGMDLRVGDVLSVEDEERFVAAQTEVIVVIANGERSLLERSLRLTRVLRRPFSPDAVSFSGGVADYIFAREQRSFGDLGQRLGTMLQAEIASGGIRRSCIDLGEGIRATVVGASTSTVQLSGNTLTISRPELLPVHNVPVLHLALPLWTTERPLNASELAAAVREAVSARGLSLLDALAVTLSWRGDPSHHNMARVAQALQEALDEATLAPLIVLFDQDVAASIGKIALAEFPFLRPLVTLDGLDVGPFDHLDVGAVIEPAGAVPVVIKSLLFGLDR